MDTVYAVSTAQGKAGVAVIRISGPEAHHVAERLGGDIPPYRKASVRVLKDATGAILDEALVLTFEENHSFTGEASVELQVHGSIVVLSSILTELMTYDGLRPAEPGEFTRRALDNGRLDLAQVEGLADLIEAETEAQRRQAIRVLAGDLGKRAETWRQKLIRAVALLEATIDFADEDVPVDVSPEVIDLVGDVISALKVEIDGVQSAERIRAGFEVAIVGAPNVGKSTLLNMLAGRDAAITSEFAGTTRDVIEVRMDLAGLPVTLLDTAGLRDTDDVVENIGIARARQRAEQADLRVFLIENNTKPDFQPQEGDIVRTAKVDLVDGVSDGVSGKTGAGISDLIEDITRFLKARSAGAGIATRFRHRQAMERGCDSLTNALARLPDGEASAEIVAEELHIAIRALDSLVGRVDVENILDEIFASFCLGK